jgi:hypothetical protein
MARVICFLIVLSFCSACNYFRSIGAGFRTRQYVNQKVECEIQKDESFDTAVMVNNSKFNLKCFTECGTEFTIFDTINDTLVKQYRDRFFKFKIQYQQFEKEIFVTKKLIKKEYDDILTYEKSVMVYPRFEKIDPENNYLMIHAKFMNPKGIPDTDFFDDVFFEIGPDGKVTLIKVVPYQEPPQDQ